MRKYLPKPLPLNLSVEEENLAAIPFAVLERRVGKKIGKIEIEGAKVLPDGTEVNVLWQVQGNNDLGLPTEQDLDVFVALGVITFRENFTKTIVFTGREIAKILHISNVHGKFYQRLKLAMDRFIPLRFRALASTDRQEEVKWINVFQEANFSLDRTTGRCTGSVTWTDKLIQSMDSGFFRLLDANRYMELDGITAKHLYRFLAVAFEKTDLILIDARKLATEHLGIFNPPKYLSRLMQTLEPAFDQLVKVQVLGSYHVVAPEEWRIALRRHHSYVPERKALLLQTPSREPALMREYCAELLKRQGFSSKVAAEYSSSAATPEEFHALERAAHILEGMQTENVIPHVALSYVRRGLDMGPVSPEGKEWLDWCEIALHVCQQKKRARQKLTNAAGLLVKIVKDPDARRRFVTEEQERTLKESFRRREQAARRVHDEQEERNLILEYEQFRDRAAHQCLQELPEAQQALLRQQKEQELSNQQHFQRLPRGLQEAEIDAAVLREIARKEVPPLEKWRLRKQAQQFLLPFSAGEEAAPAKWNGSTPS